MMKELITIKNENGQQLVNARELHEFLGSGQDFTTWIKGRIEKYGFIENQDFTFHKIMEGKVWKHEYGLTLGMAKELSMVENNDQGRQARKYFIECENQLKIQLPKLSKELQAIFALDAKQQELEASVVEVKNIVEKLKDNMTIDYSQQLELNSLAKKVVINILGGKDALAYKELNKKVFSQIWKDYQKTFDVNSYRNTSTKDYEKAKQYINNWKTNRELELMILGANSERIA